MNTNPDALDPETGATLRRMRESADVGLRELARQAGIHESTLSRFERGERVIAHNTYAHVVASLAVLLRQRGRAAA